MRRSGRERFVELRARALTVADIAQTMAQERGDPADSELCVWADARQGVRRKSCAGRGDSDSVDAPGSENRQAGERPGARHRSGWRSNPSLSLCLRWAMPLNVAKRHYGRLPTVRASLLNDPSANSDVLATRRCPGAGPAAISERRACAHSPSLCHHAEG